MSFHVILTQHFKAVTILINPETRKYQTQGFSQVHLIQYFLFIQLISTQLQLHTNKHTDKIR